MPQQVEKKSIVQMAMGAIQERIDYEMTKVIDNIVDLNTKAAAKRSLVITIDLLPGEDRQTIAVSATAKSKLCATNAVMTSLFITNDVNGEMAVVEMVPEIPGQLGLDAEEQPRPQILQLVSSN